MCLENVKGGTPQNGYSSLDFSRSFVSFMLASRPAALSSSVGVNETCFAVTLSRRSPSTLTFKMDVIRVSVGLTWSSPATEIGDFIHALALCLP